MKVIKEIPIKSKTWGAMIGHSGQGSMVEHFLTEYCPDVDGFENWRGCYRLYKDLGVNVVLEGSITVGAVSRGRSAAGCNVFSQGQSYYMSVGNVVKALEALARGTHHASGGMIHGLWTFAKQGDTISLTPYFEG